MFETLYLLYWHRFIATAAKQTKVKSARPVLPTLLTTNIPNLI